jgi:hypothetical protein
VLLIRYAHDVETTSYFSSLCDVRVIWGGDATVSEIRKLPLPPSACELAFANKFSIAIINARNWNDSIDSKKQQWLEQFFNDVYWFGQMACSSPRLMVWHGDEESVQFARDSFWSGLSAVVRKRATNLTPVDYVNKLVAVDRIALRLPSAIVPKSSVSDILRIEVELPYVKQLIDSNLHCGSGLFYETSIDTLENLLPILNRRIQTVAYAGYGDGLALREFIATCTLRGIDRIVPFGRALEFSPIWDGYDLFRVFLRQVTLN